jgi:hypothetical protein
MGFKEDRFVDKNQETYPMASRYKKNTQAQVTGRKASEINLSHFVRDKKQENRKRNMSRTSNRTNKYKTTLTLLEDEDGSLPIPHSQIPKTPKKKALQATTPAKAKSPVTPSPNKSIPSNSALHTPKAKPVDDSDYSDSDTDRDSDSFDSSSVHGPIHSIPSPELTRTPSGRNAIPMSPAGRMIRSTSASTPKNATSTGAASPFATSLPSGLLSPAPSQASGGQMHTVQTLQKMNTTDAVSAAVFQVHQLDCSLHIAIPLQDLVIFLTSLHSSLRILTSFSIHLSRLSSALPLPAFALHFAGTKNPPKTKTRTQMSTSITSEP